MTQIVPKYLVPEINVLAVERERQIRLGHTNDEDMPDGTGPMLWEPRAFVAKADCDIAAGEGRCTWAHVLREEVAEALEETVPSLLYDELIQVAAVSLRWARIVRMRHELREERQDPVLADLRHELTLAQAGAEHARAAWVKVSTNGSGKSIALTNDPQLRALRLARVLARKHAKKSTAAYLAVRNERRRMRHYDE